MFMNIINSISINKCVNCQQEGRRTEGTLEKKERSSKTKLRDEQKELRREKKLGRKRVNNYSIISSLYSHTMISIINPMYLLQDRAEESVIATEQKRRKDDERGQYIILLEHIWLYKYVF